MNKLCANVLFKNRYLPKQFIQRHKSRNSQIITSLENTEKINKFKEEKMKKHNMRSGEKFYLNLKDEFGRASKGNFGLPEEKVPMHSDYVIIGGGIMGSSIAYAMKNRAPDSFEVMVVERDPKVIFHCLF